MSTDRTPIETLAAEGVSIWLDDLSRERIQSGNLRELIEGKGVVGVTTNPSIFQAALAEGEAYTAQISELAGSGASVDDAVFALTTDDVRAACDLFADVADRSEGQDGRVSIEVDPRLAHDTDGTVEAARMVGASRSAIVGGVLVREALPAIVGGITVTVITLVGYSAMAGALGAGGLGALAINHGYNRFQTDVMVVTVIVIVVPVQLIQMLGDLVARLVDHR